MTGPRRTRPGVAFVVGVLTVSSMLFIVARVAINNQGVADTAATTEQLQRVQAQVTRQGEDALMRICTKINRVQTKLRTILTRGSRMSRQFYVEGTITLKQYQRSLKESVRAVNDLANEDCEETSQLVPKAP